MRSRDRHETLFASVLEHPDDDAARLVYADALEEAGDPERAELITIATELATSRWRHLNGNGPLLAARHAELLDEHQSKWIETIAAKGATDVRFHRGFVSEITIHAPTFVRNAKAIFRAEPLLRGIHLTGIEELRTRDLAALLALDDDDGPLASGAITTLGFPNATMDRSRIEAIFSKESIATARVRSLNLARTSWDANFLRSLSILEPSLATHIDLSHLTRRVVGERQRAEPLTAAAAVLELFPRASHITMHGDGAAMISVLGTIRKKHLVSLDARVVDDDPPRYARPRLGIASRLFAESAVHVRELQMTGFACWDEIVGAIAGAPFLSELEALSLGDSVTPPARSSSTRHDELIGMLTTAVQSMSKLEVLSLKGLTPADEQSLQSSVLARQTK